MLKTRLLVEQWWSDHAELDEERIEAPIFIVGLSRSGTTALTDASGAGSPQPVAARVGGVVTGSSSPPAGEPLRHPDARFAGRAEADEFGLLHQLNPAIRCQCTTTRPQPPAGRVPRPDGAALRGRPASLRCTRSPRTPGGCSLSITVRCTGGMNVCCDSCSLGVCADVGNSRARTIPSHSRRSRRCTPMPDSS